MKQVMLLIIRLYQKVFPKKWRGQCIYSESCSNHVFRITKKMGYKAGITALKKRYRNCRPGYVLTEIEGQAVLKTAGNEVLTGEQIDPRLLQLLPNDFLEINTLNDSKFFT